MAKTKEQKLSVQLRPHQNSGDTATTASTEPPCSPLASPPALPGAQRAPNMIDLTNLTFKEYRALGLSTAEQHELIGQIRSELPLMEVHEIDSWLLDSLAKQLDMRVFTTAKMMHLDPCAVKRMLDTEFRKAYGSGVEADLVEQEQRRHERLGSVDIKNDFVAQPAAVNRSGVHTAGASVQRDLET